MTSQVAWKKSNEVGNTYCPVNELEGVCLCLFKGFNVEIMLFFAEKHIRHTLLLQADQSDRIFIFVESWIFNVFSAPSIVSEFVNEASKKNLILTHTHTLALWLNPIHHKDKLY